MRSLLRDVTGVLATALLAVSCGSSNTVTTTTQTISKYAGDNQSATVGTAVAIRPAVKITDQNGGAISGVTVTFSVASGGGSVTAATATSGSDGLATLGSWTLGPAAGTNTLIANASSTVGFTVTFTATGVAAAVPTTMTKQGGDNQNATVGTAVAIAPSVKVVDQSSNALAGVTVTFAASTGGSVTGGSTTTNASGIATVGSWTLAPTAGANTLTATATGSGITGNPATFTATGLAAAFSPTSSTTLSGTQSFSSVNIPVGVTVTMSADLALTVSGPVTIAGTLSGDCVNVTMTITGALNSSGNINNGCSTVPTTPPTMTLVATGGYHLTAGTITLGGSLNLTNDATLTDATFPVPPAPGIRAAGGSGAALNQAGVCTVFLASFVASPATAKAGTNGQFGTNGADGSTWTLQCTGELDITGGVNVTGQNGGPGGTGTHSSATAAVATGGNGGKGGIIQVRANNGDLVINGAANSIASGSGGAGGTATATGTGAGNPGASASATGGNGNVPGNIVVQSKNGGITINGLALIMGSGGAGGAGTAIGGLGQTATPCPAGAGGPATAIGGVGGSTPDKKLTATGSVTGLPTVTVGGGAAGVGGAATATAGNGGNGAQPCKPGGNGGAPGATGGKGGDALIKDALGVLIANGGRGGSMEDVIGKGGNGWSDCVLPFESGGNGGTGGTVAGKNGVGGNGLQNGAPGNATFTTVANGGNGGDGMGPGGGGAPGGSNANNTVVATTIQPSFVPGIPGNWCAITKTVTFSLTTPATDDPAGHESVLQLVAAGPHTANISTAGLWNNLIPGPLFTCTFNPTTGVITCTAAPFTFAARNITSAVFTGTWNVATQQLVGDLILTIQGQPQTVKYHIVDP